MRSPEPGQPLKGPIRLLYVINAFENDAPSSVTISVARAMHDAGHVVRVIAWSRGGPAQELLDKAGIITDVLGQDMVRNIFTLARITREFRPTIIHSALVRPSLGTWLARRFVTGADHRWVASDHGVHEWAEKGRLYEAIMDITMPLVLNCADFVTTPSVDSAARLTARGVSGDRIRVISNGVDLRRFYPGPKGARCAFLQKHFPADDPAMTWPLIGSAGNLRGVKGYDILLDAWEKILREHPTARCVIWGTGPERFPLEKQAADLKIDHSVAFVGYEANLENYLSLLDLYIQPSRLESFGLAAAEAMACEVTAVVSRAGALPHLVDQGNAGVIFESGNAEDLAEQVLLLLSDRRRLIKPSQRGRRRVMQHFSRQRMIDSHAKLYTQLAVEVEQG